MKQVEDSTYLSSVVTSDGKCIQGNERGGGGTTRTLRRLRQRMWAKKEKSLKVKWRFFYVIMISVLLYGATAWAPKTTEERSLYAFEIGLLRIILGFIWSDFVWIADIEDMLCKAPLSLKLRGPRIKCFGHVEIMERSAMWRESCKQRCREGGREYDHHVSSEGLTTLHAVPWKGKLFIISYHSHPVKFC